MKKWFDRLIIPAAMLLLLSIVYLPTHMAAQEQDVHKVSVNVMLLPVFVTGANGEPVHGLTKDDFELQANGQKAEIAHFLRFDFQHQQETEETVTIKTPVKQKIKKPTRAVFIILDSVFIEFFGFRRAKKIAIDIIQRGSSEDMFIVIENHVAGGPRHIAGPDEPREEIIKKIKRLKLPSSKWSKNLHLTREWNTDPDGDNYDGRYVSAAFENLGDKTNYLERMAYKNQALTFGSFLKRIKYALKTINRPKVVFLISEGIAKVAFKNLEGVGDYSGQGYSSFYSALLVNEKRVSEVKEDRDMRMFSNLVKVVKAINEGGSVLYTINPGRIKSDYEASGEMSLRYLAHESGGEYIAGKETTKIIKKVKTITSAYYEIAFVPTPDMGQNINVELKCKRPGVKVNTFRKAEKTKPYFRMDNMEKKIFALNMVTGGSWSRLMGKVVRVKFRKLRNQSNGNESAEMIEIPLPPKMANKKLDIFSIRLNPKNHKADIAMVSQEVKDRANLIVKKSQGTREYFVIIEPVFTYCIYNQV